MRNLTILIIFLITVLFANGQIFAQAKIISKLYTEKGKLIADSSLHISKGQLLRWRTVEDSVLEKIRRTIEYPMCLLEKRSSIAFFYSFKIDKNGSPIDITFEKYVDENFLEKPVTISLSLADTSIQGQIRLLSGAFKSLHNYKQADARYYLPYKFETFDLKVEKEHPLVDPTFKISLGWIVYINPMPYTALIFDPPPIKPNKPQLTH